MSDRPFTLKLIEEARDKYKTFEGKQFREQQIEALQFIIESERRLAVLNAPPGSGKSLIGMTLASIFHNTIYLCSSKILQDQLEREFPEAKVMKGRNNFQCQRNEMLACDNCSHTKRNPCEYRKYCHYDVQKRAVMNWPLKILNYSYFLNECAHVGMFSGSPLVICDEADTLKDHIANFIQLEVPLRLIEEFKLGEPKYKTAVSEKTIESWKDWAKSCIEILNVEVRRLKFFIEDWNGDPKSSDLVRLIKRQQRVEGYIYRFVLMIRYVDDTWIWQEVKSNFGGRWEFKPTWLTEPLSEEYFFRHGQRFVMMSGTFPPDIVIAKQVGFPIGDMDHLEVPSMFPIENRWVIMRPRYTLTRATAEEATEKIKAEVRTLLDRHWKEKGIIHAVSYKLAQTIMSTGDARLITHNSKDRDEVIQKFKDSDNPLVLVSPVLTRGVDLPDDLCRFIIWAKTPFLDLSDEVTKRRLYQGKFGQFWYRSEAAQTIIQGAGRGVRHATDKCVTYILDELGCNLIKENYRLFPGWFRDALREE